MENYNMDYDMEIIDYYNMDLFDYYNMDLFDYYINY